MPDAASWHSQIPGRASACSARSRWCAAGRDRRTRRSIGRRRTSGRLRVMSLTGMQHGTTHWTRIRSVQLIASGALGGIALFRLRYATSNRAIARLDGRRGIMRKHLAITAAAGDAAPIGGAVGVGGAGDCAPDGGRGGVRGAGGGPDDRNEDNDGEDNDDKGNGAARQGSYG